MSKLNSQFLYDYGLPYPGPTAKTSVQIMENINHLYKKIDQCTRNVSYFDLYNFNTIITNPSELQSQINALVPYSSAIINVNSEVNGVNYFVGDIVVKNNDSSSDIIRAQRGGIFYPSSISKINKDASNYTYNIQFLFQNVEPTISKTIVADKNQDQIWDSLDNDTKTLYAREIIFEGLAGGSVGSPYNCVYSSIVDKISVDAAFKIEEVESGEKIETAIPPIVHCYANNEEIYIDQEIFYKNEEEKKYYEIKIASCGLCNKVVIK